ncbi:MAG TPA: DUF167 domain-containing protein [Bacteroidia bacterium]|jgi:uncharacterized protein (TIGR00251 family)|nr:DUF167 domain-containing protein [Bacteroidia bacterium]
MIPLNIRVKAGSFKDEIAFDTEGNLIIKIREKPIDGAANDYLVKYLSKEFKINKSSIVLEKGQTSPFKKLLINLQPAELETLLSKYKK